MQCISQRRVLKLVLFLRETWLKKFTVQRLFLWFCQKMCIRDYTVMVTLAKNNFQRERQKADTADFKVNAP